MQVKWQGIAVVFDIDGKTLTASNGFSYNNQAGTIVTNATVKFLNGTYNFGSKAFPPHIVDGLTTIVSNATLSKTGSMLVQTSNQDNSSTGSTLSIIEGANVSVNAAVLHGAGNSMLIDGDKTVFTTTDVFYVGHFAGQDGNSLVIANGATVNAGKGFIVGRTYNDNASMTSASNVVTVSDGATLKISGGSYGAMIGRNGGWNTLRVESRGIVTNDTSSPLYIGKASNHNTVVVDGAGSCIYSEHFNIGSTTGARNNQFIATAGAECRGKTLKFGGKNNSLALDNATMTFSNLYTTNDTASISTTGTRLYIAGANAKLTTTNLNGGDKGFAGSEVFEFVIPATGWAEAPFQDDAAFTIPEVLC